MMRDAIKILAVRQMGGRLIDADELIALIDDDIAALKDGYFEDFELPPTAYGSLCVLRMVREYIKALPTIEAEPRWIPIEQDCPEKGKDVLISHNGVVSIDWLTQSEGIGYFFVSGVAVQDIDAWMPLPEPYKEAEHETD